MGKASNTLKAVAICVMAVLATACSRTKAPEPTPQSPPPAASTVPPRDLAMRVDVTPPPPAPPAIVLDPCIELRSRLSSSKIHFDHDRANISPSAVAEVDAISAAIKASTSAKLATFSIEGHCDATGSDGYNVALSERRAQTVLERLLTLGAITADRSKTVPWGKQQPLDPADTPEAYAKNRRVEVVLHCPTP